METMNEKLVHLEFMKIYLGGVTDKIDMGLYADHYVRKAVEFADAALLQYQKRWEGKKDTNPKTPQEHKCSETEAAAFADGLFNGWL